MVLKGNGKLPGVLVLGSLGHEHISRVANAISPAEVVQLEDPAGVREGDAAWGFLKNAEVILTWGSHFGPDILQRAGNLRWVQVLSAGVNNLLFPELVESDVVVSNAQGCYGIPIAEHCLALMLAFARGLPAIHRQQPAKYWNRSIPVGELHGKTLGILGLGGIGRQVAKRAKGFNMRVLATRSNPVPYEYADEVLPTVELARVLQDSDFLVVAVPLVPETEGMIGANELRSMKSSAVLINVARGSVVDEEALIAALREGVIAGAGLDVFEEEPLPTSSPLWMMPDVIVSPHISGTSPMSRGRVLDLFIANYRRYVAGEELLNVVDKGRGY